MVYRKRFDTGISDIVEKLRQLLESKNIPVQLDPGCRQKEESGSAEIVKMPTGWATLTVNTSHPRLCNELDDFFRKFEGDVDEVFERPEG